MKTYTFVLALICAAVPCAAQSGELSDWGKLLDQNNPNAAKALCSRFVNSSNKAQQVEAQICLANVALAGNSEILLEGDNAGGGNLRSGYKKEAADEAILHLDLALKLAPQDVTIHEGRLHILEVSGRYTEMIKALDESCSVYEGKDAPDVWLAYAPELNDLRQYQVGLDFMKVLDRHYPNNPDVIGNTGAFLNLLKKDDEAIPYLQRAVELAPQDRINAWDLGRAYDYLNQVALADKWYQNALSLPADQDQPSDIECLYAQFVETKLHDQARACTLEKKGCKAEEQTACTAPVDPTKTEK